jgi:glycosyltransferase involved in cell wall biosynthesis
MVDFVFEVSSEAGRKIGGIYTVIQSKAAHLLKKYGDGYCFIGFLDEKCDEEIDFQKPPAELASIFRELAAAGIAAKYGRWTAAAAAPIIVVSGKEHGERRVDYFNGTQHIDRQVNYYKYLLWKNFGIDSLGEKSWDFDENVAWGFAAGMLLQKLLSQKKYHGKKTVVQFHEWISGAALLYCKMNHLPIATVFTTHATVLGRALSSAGRDVLAEAKREKSQINSSEAYRFKVEGKHQLEEQAAKSANVFTTVSETVGDEVQYILGKKPDIITLNGLDFSGMSKENEIRNLAEYSRGELIQFTEAVFGPYYRQRYDNALLTYISGRYEFLNKGFDIYIKALGKLNKRLSKKMKKTDRRIFAFIFAPSSVKGPKISIIKNYLLTDKIYEVLEQLPGHKGKKYQNLHDAVDHLSGTIKKDVQNMMSGLQKEGPRPHINCFDIAYQNDIIINTCVQAGLTNEESNAVKIIFYPTYLKPNDGLMNMNYYDIISGMDVGIFPSRYEPFGYTPVETALKLTVPITSDLTGFGRYMLSAVPDLSKRGLRIIRMSNRTTDQAAEELSEEIEKLYFMDDKKLEALKSDAFNLMSLCDWKNLAKNYFDAYELAAKRAYERKK